MTDYAIIGMSIMDSLGRDLDTNWQRFLKGDSPVGPITKFDVSKYPGIKIKSVFELDDTNFQFNDRLTTQDFKFMDRVSIVGFYTAMNAIEQAGIEGKKNTAVIYSSLGSANRTILECTEAMLAGKRTAPRKALATQRDGISGLISRKFGFFGLNITMTSACASGINSLDYACRLLDDGVYDQVVVGASDVTVDPMDIYMFQSIGALDSRENAVSRPFDEDRGGFIMGEGSAAYVIKRLDKALASGDKIISIIKGIGFANESFHETAIEDNGIGARMSIDMALIAAGLTKDDIDFVNCHATCTPQGDIIEYNVISDYFPGVTVQALKGNIGHTMAACGLIETAYMIKSMKEEITGPIANLTKPLGDKILLPKTVTPINSKYGLKTSFGFGGKSAAMIIEKA